jgi:hypothetical protein
MTQKPLTKTDKVTELLQNVRHNFAFDLVQAQNMRVLALRCKGFGKVVPAAAREDSTCHARSTTAIAFRSVLAR